MLKRCVANRCGRRLAIAGLVSALLFSLVPASSAQILRRARRGPATGTAPEAPAPQVTGQPGSPGATTTISGQQLPPPDPPFGGVIKENAAQSKAWWAPRVVPPKGTPNVL